LQTKKPYGKILQIEIAFNAMMSLYEIIPLMANNSTINHIPLHFIRFFYTTYFHVKLFPLFVPTFFECLSFVNYAGQHLLPPHSIITGIFVFFLGLH